MKFSYRRVMGPEGIAGQVGAETVLIAGGTELVPLMRAGIVRPKHVVDIGLLDFRQIEHSPDNTLSLGALAIMADVAAHPLIRSLAPAVSQALWESASPQVRNAATLGGNLMQRTRCGFFRDTAFACNKRAPGSGCPANDGGNRNHAIFGGSRRCRAVHASDLATALSSLNAAVRILRHDGSERDVAIETLYMAPDADPARETVLGGDEIISEIRVPLNEASRRSVFMKVRDRATFEFAVVSVAVAAEILSEMVQDIRISLGGVAYKPWRLTAVEHRLRGRLIDQLSVGDALEDFAADAEVLHNNGYKVDLCRALVSRAVGSAVGMR